VRLNVSFNPILTLLFDVFQDVFDIYREKQGSITLLDFNPFGQMTDSKLFDWEELEHPEQHETIAVRKRVIESYFVNFYPFFLFSNSAMWKVSWEFNRRIMRCMLSPWKPSKLVCLIIVLTLSIYYLK
jgi:D123